MCGDLNYGGDGCFGRVAGFIKRSLRKEMTMDINQAARQQAQAENKAGQPPANTSNWDYDARSAYESERNWLQQQEANKKS